MGKTLAVLLSILSITLLAGCLGRVEVGFDRTPTPAPALEATIVAMAADNARLATQVAALNAAGPAAPVSAAASTPAPSVAATVATPSAAAATAGLQPAAADNATPSPTPSLTPQSAKEPTSAPPTAAVAATRSSAGPVGVVTGESINLRAGPGTGYPVVGQARRGDELALLGRNATGDWVQVGPRDHVAWVLASLLAIDPSTPQLAVVTNIPPLPTPTVAPTGAPSRAVAPTCDVVPIRGFGQVWGAHPEVAALLGCPSTYPAAGEIGTEAAVQTFEHGLMLWLAADSGPSSDPVYVLFDDGEYQRFPDLGPADPAVVGATDAGFSPIGSHFSKAYWEGTGARVRQRLGRATSPQTDSAAAYQQFWNGRMFWTKSLTRIFALYDYWRYPPGQPSVRVRTWTSFEDTFGQ